MHFFSCSPKEKVEDDAGRRAIECIHERLCVLGVAVSRECDGLCAQLRRSRERDRISPNAHNRGRAEQTRVLDGKRSRPCRLRQE